MCVKLKSLLLLRIDGHVHRYEVLGNRALALVESLCDFDYLPHVFEITLDFFHVVHGLVALLSDGRVKILPGCRDGLCLTFEP